MKKLISVLLVVVLCLALTCSVYAAEDDFVPSITYKAMPAFAAGTQADDGCQVIGYAENGEGQQLVVHYENGSIYVDGLHEGEVGEDHTCLVITPLAEAETGSEIPDASRERLLWVYEQILSMGMDFFADCEELASAVIAVLGQGASVEDLVVKELFDVSVLCDELEEYLEPAGTTICLDFDLGIEPGTFVSVVAFKNGQWQMIEDVEVEADGSVTCTTYENFCPVAVLVPASEEVVGDVATAPDTGDGIGGQVGLWAVIAGVSLAAIVVLAMVQRKRGAGSR